MLECADENTNPNGKFVNNDINQLKPNKLQHKATAQQKFDVAQEDVQKLQRKKEDLDEKLNTLQKDVYRGTEQLDQFKLLMNWNQEELEQWALASRQKEEDNLALQKYMRADDVRIKELNLHIEKMAKSVSEKTINAGPST